MQFVISETFEFHRQARRPGNYFGLGVAMAMAYAGWSQGWALMAIVLCGPFLALVLVRLVLNAAEGFRLTANGVELYSEDRHRNIAWRDIANVTIGGDGKGGARCVIHLRDDSADDLPATGGFSPERLGQEFRARGVPVWRVRPQTDPATQAYLQ